MILSNTKKTLTSKKLIAIPFMGLLFFCCTNEPQNTTIEAEQTHVAFSIETASPPPDFENAKLDSIMKEFHVFFYEMLEAFESKDQEKIKELNTRGRELTERTQQLEDELSLSDKQMLEKYLEDRGKEFSVILSK
jgi:hypothetical protein